MLKESVEILWNEENYNVVSGLFTKAKAEEVFLHKANNESKKGVVINIKESSTFMIFEI